MSEQENCLGGPLNEGSCLEVMFYPDGRVKYRYNPQPQFWPQEEHDVARLVGTFEIIRHQIVTWFATRMQAALLADQVADARLMDMLAKWEPGEGKEN